MPRIDDFGGVFTAYLTVQVPDGRGGSTTQPLPGLSDPEIVATFRFEQPSGEVVEKTGTITLAAKGIVQWKVESGFFDVAGAWKWEVRVTKTGALQYTSQAEQFIVDDHL